MNCQTFQNFLNESESALRAPDLLLPLQEHLHNCSSCQMEWLVYQRMLAALAREPEQQPAASFTAAVMAKLPATPVRKRRFDLDALLLVALIPAAGAALWYMTRTFWPNWLEQEKLQSIYVLMGRIMRDFLQMTFGKVEEAIVHALAYDMMAQVGQVMLIAFVTFLVARSAVLLENRIRRMLKG